MSFSSRNKSTDRRNQNIDSNRTGLGLVKVNLPELKEFDVITFAYQAEESGVARKGMNPPNPNLYDANPMIVLTDWKRVNGKMIIYGLNANYLFSKFAKGRLIFAMREERDVARPIYDRTIHAYRLDRVKSALYMPRDFLLDKDLLTSLANWKLAKKRSEF